jgi:hypothetical protein
MEKIFYFRRHSNRNMQRITSSTTSVDLVTLSRTKASINSVKILTLIDNNSKTRTLKIKNKSTRSRIQGRWKIIRIIKASTSILKRSFKTL